MLSIFFRDDDADRDLPQLRRLLDLFRGARVPLNLAVIPGTLDASCARLLRAQGDWLEVHQHGWLHTNHEATGRKCEFGVSRSYLQQRAYIAAGQQRMNDLLGASWQPIFTPPWNRCTAETHRALRDLGFAAVSQSVGGVLPGTILPQLPISVDIFTWKQSRRLKSCTQVIAEIAQAPVGVPIGILLHHKVMEEAAFAATREVLACLQSLESAVFHTMGQLMASEEALCRN